MPGMGFYTLYTFTIVCVRGLLYIPPVFPWGGVCVMREARTLYYAYALWKESRLQKSGGPRLILPEKCYLFFFYIHYYLYFFPHLTDAADNATTTIAHNMIISAPFGGRRRRAIVGVLLQENPVERKTGAHRNIYNIIIDGTTLHVFGYIHTSYHRRYYRYMGGLLLLPTRTKHAVYKRTIFE